MLEGYLLCSDYPQSRETGTDFMQLDSVIDVLQQLAPQDGVNYTALPYVALFKETEQKERFTWLYEPLLIVAFQGKKHLYLDGTRYIYGAGQALAVFMPMVCECEVVEASLEEPLLAIGIRLDRHRLANLLLKMDSVDQSSRKLDSLNTSGIFSSTLNGKLMATISRLLDVLQDPVESAILGDSVIDEIYYRLLLHEQGGALRVLLQQQGQFQQIAKAVEYLTERLEQNISVDELASSVNMSVSGFHRKFKEVMHVSPLQYTKLIRLNKARTFIMEGKTVSEAGYLVGYNSPAQFSREYKRQFGVVPSAT